MSCLCKWITTPGCICVSCARERGFPQALYVESRDYTVAPTVYCDTCGVVVRAEGETRCFKCRHVTRRVA